MQEIVKFFLFDKRFSTIIDASRRLSTFYDIIFYIISFLILCIIFFSVIFLFHSHNFFLRSFCHIKNNASSTFSKSKKCNASFFSNFCFSLPPYTGISSRQMRYRLHPPASFLSRPSMERHSPLFRSANSDPADNLPLLY